MLVVLPMNPDVMGREQGPLEHREMDAMRIVGAHMFHVNPHPENSPEGSGLRQHEKNKQFDMAGKNGGCGGKYEKGNGPERIAAFEEIHDNIHEFNNGSATQIQQKATIIFPGR